MGRYRSHLETLSSPNSPMAGHASLIIEIWQAISKEYGFNEDEADLPSSSTLQTVEQEYLFYTSFSVKKLGTDIIKYWEVSAHFTCMMTSNRKIVASSTELTIRHSS